MGADYKEHFRDDHRPFNKLALNDDVFQSPIDLFSEWLRSADDNKILDYNAMSLSTSNGSGRVSSRIVYLKDIIDHSLVFFTNYNSRKGKDIELNPNGSLLFFWKEMERQVRVEGQIVKVEEKISDAYFESRPVASQLGAITSDQSEVVESRSALEQNFELIKMEHAGKEIKRPDNWGGYALIPSYFEFWQGREHRLHDRITFELQEDGSWKVSRLNP
jgi:pyridoxamine 5'-phosphate oxidase